MWFRVHIVALTALLAASYLPDRIEADPVRQHRDPWFCSRMYAYLTARVARFRHLPMCSCAATRSRKSQLIASQIDNIANAMTIDGGGRTLMPGLIDVHWHAMLVRPNPVEAMASDIGYLNLLAGAEATATLMRGFTTIRDMGGPVFGLKRAIDEGLLPGPRIYPSGAVITITGGHGDFRSLSDLPRRAGTLSRVEETGAAMIADSPDEVRLRTREQLMQGASQIKLTAGGGVASPFSPLDVVTFTEPELRAAVEAAENWGTYVCTHAYTPVSIQRSIAAGVKCIEHGHLMDDETARLMAEKGIWLSTQPFLDEEGEGGAQQLGPAEQAKMKQVSRRNRQRLPTGEEVPSQDRVRHRHPVFRARSGAAG